jgi:serralysin
MKKYVLKNLLLVFIFSNTLLLSYSQKDGNQPLKLTPVTTLGNIQSGFKPGRYIIKIETGLKALDVDRGSINTNKPKLQLWDVCADYKKNCEPQLWYISSANKNTFAIKLSANGKYLTVNPFKKTELLLMAKIGGSNSDISEYQSWNITNIGNGLYSIKSAMADAAANLSLAYSTAQNGGAIMLQKPCENVKAACGSQLFTFFSIPDAPKMCAAFPLPSKPTKPACTNCEVGVNIEPLVAATAKMWKPGSTLRVRMDGGSAFVRSKVIQYANEWTRYANIRFNFISSGDAEIIVTFGNDGSSWSYLGTDCIDPGIRFVGNFTQNGTTHFGWFTDETSEEEFSRVIVHEFGHALGFEHEQSHPESGIPWDREAVYNYYATSQNPPWDRNKVNAQVFEVASRSHTQFSSYDRNSIMHYSISNELTIGDFEVPWNTRLSETDKAFARLMYPAGTVAGNRLRIKIGTGGDDVRVNSNVLIYLKLNSTALPSFTKSLNNGAGWGGNSSNTVEIALPAGVGITDIQECKILFTSGKQFEWDTPDNWNLDKLVIEFVTADGFASTIANRTGTPYVRFYNTGEVLLLRR